MLNRLTQVNRGAFLAILSLWVVAQLSAQWPVAIGGAATGPPAIDRNGTLYVLAEDRYLYAFDRSGDRQWRVDVGAVPTSGPVLCPGGPVIVGSRDGIVRAVSPAGSVVQRLTPAGKDASAPMAAYCDEEGFVHIAYESGLIRRVSPAGVPVWERQLKHPPVLPPISDDIGRIFVPTQGEVLEVLGADGIRIERLPTDTLVTAQAVVNGWYLAGTAGGRIIGYGPEGEVRNRHIDAGAIAAIVGAGDGRTFVLTAAGELYAPHTPWASEASAPPRPATGVSQLSGLDGLRTKSESGGSSSSDGSASERRIYELFVAGPSTIHRLVLGNDGRELHARERVVTSYAGKPLRMAGVGFGMVVLQSEEWIISAAQLASSDGLEGGSWTGPRGSPLRSGFPIDRDAVNREERWEESLDYIFLESHLLSSSRSDRIRALRDIEERVASGTLLGSTDYVVALLRRAAFQDFRGSSAGQTGFGDIRARVVRLLGRIGGRSAIGDLAQLARYTYTPAVDAEILAALARVPGAVAEQGMSVVEQIVRRHSGRGAGETGSAAVGSAAVEAVRALLTYRGAGTETTAAGELLAEIVGGAYPRAVREEALRLLRNR